MIDIGGLRPYPLLLLDSGYSIRRLFDAACRLAEVEPNILLESRAPHIRVTHRRKPVRDRFVVQWDKRRPMPPYATVNIVVECSYNHQINETAARRPGQSTRRNFDRPRTGSGKNISPRLHHLVPSCTTRMRWPRYVLDCRFGEPMTPPQCLPTAALPSEFALSNLRKASA
jgi:hypothetical protein